MTSFDYAYKLEAVRDWLFAQTKLSTPLFVLLLPCLSYNHCFLKSNLKCTTCQKWCIVSKHQYFCAFQRFKADPGCSLDRICFRQEAQSTAAA